MNDIGRMKLNIPTNSIRNRPEKRVPEHHGGWEEDNSDKHNNDINSNIISVQSNISHVTHM